MALIGLDIPAGVVRNGTDLDSAGRWRDANLVRWENNSARPVGGWESRGVTLGAPPRGAIAWSDNGFNPNIAAGTYEKLFHVSGTNTKTEITPTNFTTGTVDAESNSGFGGYYYGLDNYGTQRPDNSIGTEATVWSVDNWGEYLVAVPSNDYAAKTIYEWQLNTSAVAAPIANSPKCNALVVTEDRFLMALSADDNPRLIKWCDREDNTAWTAAATNEAGDYLLNSTGEILMGLNTRGRVLILTTTDAHAAAYSGPPVVYGFEQVGSQCGAISRNCAVAIDEGAFWMSHNGFYAYDGSAVVDMPCDVQDYVFDDINRAQITKVHAVDNSQFNELWWFYPSGSSNECDRYVSYDYKEKHWNFGQMDRTSAIDIGVFTNPIWFDSTGLLLDQERGFSHGGVSPHLESGPILIGEGEQVMNVTSLIPDEKTLGDVTATFKTRYYPTDTERSYGPFTMANPTSVRFQGRQIRMRIDGSELVNWKAGKMRIDVKAGSKR